MPKTAVMPFWLFGFVRMPFGLQNEAQTFQHFMDHVLCGLTLAYNYIYDLHIASEDSMEYKIHLRTVFECLQDQWILINMKMRIRCSTSTIPWTLN